MKKYYLLLICLFFLTILATIYGQEINGINFNLPQEYTGGNICVASEESVYTRHR